MNSLKVAISLTACRSLILEDEDQPEKISALRKAYDMTYWFWIATIVLDLIAQSFRSAHMSPAVGYRIGWFTVR